MLFKELVSTGAYTPMQREATRILRVALKTLTINELPDGRVKFSFTASPAFIDRLAMWGADVEDLEPGSGREDDARRLPRMRQDQERLPFVDISHDLPPRMADLVAALDNGAGTA